MNDSKLKNVKAVKEFLMGEHRLQTNKTYGFSDVNASTERNKKREVGEKWTEINSNGTEIEWEQKEGYRIKSFKNLSGAVQEARDFLYSFPNCPKETCTCKVPTRIDQKFKKLMGMCEDCVISNETKLKMTGGFKDYAINKMKANAESFFKQSDIEVDILKNALHNIDFVENADGRVETWENTNPVWMCEQIDNQYNDFKNKTMEKLNV